MALSKGQLAFLACTIYQETANGKYSTEKPEGEFFYIKTPIHGPDIDGSTERPSDVPNGAPNDDGSTTQAADFWFQEYTNGVLQSRNGFGYGEPTMPTDPNSEQFKVLQEFIAANDASAAA